MNVLEERLSSRHFSHQDDPDVDFSCPAEGKDFTPHHTMNITASRRLDVPRGATDLRGLQADSTTGLERLLECHARELQVSLQIQQQEWFAAFRREYQAHVETINKVLTKSSNIDTSAGVQLKTGRSFVHATSQQQESTTSPRTHPQIACGEEPESRLKLRRSTTGMSSNQSVCSGKSGTSGRSMSSHSMCSKYKELDLRQTARDVASRQQTPVTSTTSIQHSCMRRALMHVVSLTRFELACFLLTGSNVLLLGFEVNYIATHNGAEPFIFQFVSDLYTIFFILELFLRVGAAGFNNFFCSQNSSTCCLNYLDVVINVAGVADMLIRDWSSGMNNIQVFRVLRILRLARTLRVARIARWVASFRTLFHSIIATLKSLFFALLLMVIIFYGFGIVFTQSVTDHVRSVPARNLSSDIIALEEFWGTLPRSMFTLFKSISNGLDWHQAVAPLSSVGWPLVGVFIFFIAFTVFAVLNVITGVFCQSAIESAQNDKEIATMDLLAKKEAFVQSIKALFLEIDKDHSGQITLLELEDHLDDAKFEAYFTSLGIDIHDAWTLFKLLDTTEQGSLDLESFVTGCLHLKGQAKAIHIASLEYEMGLMYQMVEELKTCMEAWQNGSQNAL